LWLFLKACGCFVSGYLLSYQLAVIRHVLMQQAKFTAASAGLLRAEAVFAGWFGH
jgi:hypothetical protein